MSFVNRETVSIEVERAARMRFLRNVDDSVERQFAARLSQLELQDRLAADIEYALSLDYQHEGLSKQAYIAHPMRVALLYFDTVSEHDLRAVRLALLHNVLEVSGMPLERLGREVGAELADAIRCLTVDRTRQWEDDYKQAYYREISEQQPYVGQIKVLDKLDNLYVLCLNPADEIRAKYLREIERWVIPLARRVLPALEKHLAELVADNRRLGHRPLA